MKLLNAAIKRWSLIQIVPDNLNNKAWVLNALKKYDEALECSNKALDLDPKSAWAFTNKARALNGLKRHDEALECSNKALELDPNSIPNWYTPLHDQSLE